MARQGSDSLRRSRRGAGSTPSDPAPRPQVFVAAIRVRPGARRTEVGGSAASTTGRGANGPGDGRGPELPPLAVSVTSRAVDGAATAAAERAVAAALGLRPHQVRVVRGQTSRDKLVEVAADPAMVAQLWAQLLSGVPGSPVT